MTDVACSPDGAQIAALSATCGLLVLDATTGEVRSAREAPPGVLTWTGEGAALAPLGLPRLVTPAGPVALPAPAGSPGEPLGGRSSDGVLALPGAGLWRGAGQASKVR